MTKYQVICTECGLVKNKVSKNGEVVEPSAGQKAKIVAEKHEEGDDDCTAVIVPNPP